MLKGKCYSCDQCIEEYEGEYGSLPIVNSPRMGVCGYNGPTAEYEYLGLVKKYIGW